MSLLSTRQATRLATRQATRLARTLAICALVVVASDDVRADSWIVAEAPAAIAVSDAQSGVFRAGVMPALGFYTDNGTTALGVRLRAGVLRNGPAPAGNLSDPGLGGLGTAGVALRFASHGAWIEGVAGGGITGEDLVPAVELGLGWDFSVGSVDLGPSARYLRVVSNDRMATLGSADLVLLGVDVRFGKARPRPARITAAPSAPVVEPAVVVERDPDRVVEHEQSCATDPDGCEIAHHIFLHNDRIVLEERVLFDVDRARVKHRGRDMIGDIARVWSAHPEWLRMTIEGHADVRGSDDYNLELSSLRAQRVREVFLELGVEPARIDAIGYGRSRPRDPAMTDDAHQRNRRVEFVIEREQPDPDPGVSP